MNVKMRNAVLANFLHSDSENPLPKIPILFCLKTSNFLSGIVAVGALAIGTAVPATSVSAAENEMRTAPLPLNSGFFAPVAPRELVQTFTDGEYAEPVRSAVTLSCSLNAGVPAPQGTHPNPEQACAELEKASGTLAGLPKDQNIMCLTVYEPVTVTISGVWDSKFVWERATYGNRCELIRATGTVFKEWPFQVN
ncbi:hypothetical protein sS8_1879 [Methylocaldum marinum]|uniref:Subtilisin inhibitor domain-containing protein n=1 Tax=Methylocaldum marinum TaxID=1432792 RepID=A0A250KQ80_9GAMM|nr:SSI family serine proteinase inhibitor [Methylocaldum marinum]BBA33833.1 hypothetical protein sS8_1879 [Methylocaldum marinum]